MTWHVRMGRLEPQRSQSRPNADDDENCALLSADRLIFDHDHPSEPSESVISELTTPTLITALPPRRPASRRGGGATTSTTISSLSASTTSISLTLPPTTISSLTCDSASGRGGVSTTISSITLPPALRPNAPASSADDRAASSTSRAPPPSAALDEAAQEDEGACLFAAVEDALAAAEEDWARSAAAAPPRYRAARSFEPTETWQLALARGDALLLLDADRSSQIRSTSSQIESYHIIVKERIEVLDTGGSKSWINF